MGAFRRALAAANQSSARGSLSRWLFVPYDQLTDRLGPLAREAPASMGIVLVECPAKAARRRLSEDAAAFVPRTQPGGLHEP